MKRIKIFALSQSDELGSKITAKLDLPLGKLKTDKFLEGKYLQVLKKRFVVGKSLL